MTTILLTCTMTMMWMCGMMYLTTILLTCTMTMMWMCGMMYHAMVRYALKQC